MGGHTWAYCKIKPETEKKIREDIHDSLKKDWKIVPDNMSEEEYVEKKYQEIHDTYPDITKEWITETIRNKSTLYKKYLTEVETCDFKTLSEILEEICGDTNYKAYNGCIYEECDFDRPVRIYGYPEEVFTDADKFIEWIKKTESEKGHTICEYYNWEDDKYVEGLDETAERLIRKFWKNYDDEVYVEFG